MSQGVTKLKELLFEPESRAIADFERRLQSVYERTGTDERLEHSVSKVLSGAMRTAEVQDHNELSQAVAPLVVQTIKTEIFASRDALVETLYPMTGRMVKAYVASAIKDLSDQINQRMALNPLMVALQVITSGRSPGEIVLANSAPLTVEGIFLIRRGSGELLARWPETSGSDNQDQMMSGVLTAINEFATEAFADDNAALRQIDLGGTQVYLRASPSYILAAKCEGPAPKAVQKLVDEAFLDAIEKHDQILTAAAQGRVSLSHDNAMSTMATELEGQISGRQAELTENAKRGPSPVKIITALIGIPLLLLLGWYMYASYQSSRVHAIASAVVENNVNMQGYPATIDVSNGGRAVVVSGFAPSETVNTQVLRQLKDALPSSKIDGQFRALGAGGPDLSPELSSVRRDVAALQSRLSQDALVRATNWANRRIGDTKTTLALLQPTRLVGAETNSTISQVGETLANAGQTLNTLRTKLQTPVSTVVELETLRPDIVSTTNAVQDATTKLRGLIGPSTQQGDQAPDALSNLNKGADLTELAENLAIQAERLATVFAAVEQIARMPAPQGANVVSPAPISSREKLIKWTQSHAIFFTRDTTYRSATQAEADLNTLAAMLTQTNDIVRIVGYTDDRGGLDKNTSLSQSRAQKVRRALISRGVPPNRLIAVGRNAARELSSETGDASPNRRVEFEVGFMNERTR